VTVRVIQTALGPRRTSVALDALERIERKDEQLEEVVAKAAATPTPSTPLDAMLDQLSRNLADGSWSLHPAVTIERRMDEDCDRVSALVYDGLRMTLREAWDLSLISGDGRWEHLRAQAIAHAVHCRDSRYAPARRLRL
jgi:hypothetical protein